MRKSTRINRRIRKYRSEKIHKEQSYNSNEALSMFYKSKTGGVETGSDGISFEDTECDPKAVFEKMDKLSKKRGFDESVEVMVKLGVDPTKGDQMIRGTCILPCGTGKEVKVCVFADM